MKSNSSRPFTRKNIRLRPSRYLGRQTYFVTVCFDGRRPYGAIPRVATWLIASLRKHAARWKLLIHAYCVMPDHVHILACAANDGCDMMAFVEAFKQDTGFAFQKRAHRRLWQFKYYDHILRARDSVDRVCWYIWMNPVRKGICSDPRKYAFAGSFTEIGIKLLRSFAPPEWSPPWKGKGENATPQ